jgi:dienelactone hydrolase
LTWAALLVVLTALSPAASVYAQQVHFEISEQSLGPVRSQAVGDRRVDLFLPAVAEGATRPAVVFVLGFSDESSPVGPLMDYEQYRAWARIVAAHGFVGVLYSTSDPVSDLGVVMQFLSSDGPRLGIDPERIGLWSASGNVPTALGYARDGGQPRVRALVTYYGLMPTPDGFQGEALRAMSSRFGFVLPPYDPGQAYPPDLPILVVRCGRDSWVELLASIDRFTDFALEQNLRVQLLNYPGGRHSFDTEDDTEETRTVIAQTLWFLARHLGDGVDMDNGNK